MSEKRGKKRGSTENFIKCGVTVYEIESEHNITYAVSGASTLSSFLKDFAHMIFEKHASKYPRIVQSRKQSHGDGESKFSIDIDFTRNFMERLQKDACPHDHGKIDLKRTTVEDVFGARSRAPGLVDEIELNLKFEFFSIEQLFEKVKQLKRKIEGLAVRKKKVDGAKKIEGQVAMLKNNVESQKKTIRNLKKEVKALKKKVPKKKCVAEADNPNIEEVAKLKAVVVQKDEEINSLKAEIERMKSSRNVELEEAVVVQKDEEINSLKAEIERMKSSRNVELEEYKKKVRQVYSGLIFQTGFLKELIS